MIWLCIGVLLFMLVHFVPSLARGFRESLIARIGEHPYKGVFSLLLVSSIALMVFGWRSTTPEFVYLPPAWGTPLTSVLMLISVMNPKISAKYINHNPISSGPSVSTSMNSSSPMRNGYTESLVVGTQRKRTTLLTYRNQIRTMPRKLVTNVKPGIVLR